eukprot:scaffold1324_cov117-Isochrysis_galbana.AAC.1
MSDSEPDWVEEQSSAQKLHATQSRLSSSRSSSPLLAPSPDPAELAQQPAQKAAAKQRAKQRAPRVPSASLPLQFAPRVRRDALLFEAVDHDLDLSGDFGCIGRLHVNSRQRGSFSAAAAVGSSPAADRRQRAALTLDLKGRVYDGHIVPTNSSLLLVTMDGSRCVCITPPCPCIGVAPTVYTPDRVPYHGLS